MDVSIKVNELIKGGKYLDAKRLMTTFSDQSPDPLYLEVSYLFYIEHDFNQCLFYIKKYLENPPTQIPKMATFLISEMQSKFTKDVDLNDIINKLDLESFKSIDSLDCKILNIELILVDPAFYIFLIGCPHCNHQFEINTFVTFLVDIHQPCPNCFNSFNFNFKLIKDYFNQLSLNRPPPPLSPPLDYTLSDILPYYFLSSNNILIAINYFLFLTLSKK